jgi:23S rRNA pseudouridine1911/1915/1917 synthase
MTLRRSTSFPLTQRGNESTGANPFGDDFLDEDESPALTAGGHAPAADDPTGARRFVVEAEAHGQRLDAWLSACIPAYSRNHLKGLIEAGAVQAGGQVVTSASRKVAQGQVVDIVLRGTAQSQAFVPEAMNLPIVFEDEQLMVINKSAGMVVHPAAGNWSGTLMNGLLAHHAGAASLPRAGIVHRLDKDTSGLMVVGKTLEAVTALSRAIAAREVKRQYLALTHGQVSKTVSINSPIGRDPITRVRMAVVPSGKSARTDVERLLCASVPLVPAVGRRPAAELAQRWISAVLCTLHTGRTHQIRVHLSSLHHPLVADAVYGGAPALGMARQALHAARLGFVHPVSGEMMLFEAPLPPDMAGAWSQLDSQTSSDNGGSA